MNVVTPELKDRMGQYLSCWKSPSAYRAKQDWIVDACDELRENLETAATWDEDETDDFLNSIWAINTFPYRLAEINKSNDHKAIRKCFRTLVTSKKASGQARIEAAHIPNIDVATLSEVLCFHFPDTYGIKNKRSTIGLCLASDTGTLIENAFDPNTMVGAEPFHSMPYDEFNTLLADVKDAFHAAMQTAWGKDKSWKLTDPFFKTYGFLLTDQFLEHWYEEYKAYLKG